MQKKLSWQPLARIENKETTDYPTWIQTKVLSYAKKLITLLTLIVMASPVAAQEFFEGLAAYHAGDDAKAFKVYKPLAEWGHAEAQSFLALMYSKGFGEPKDDAKAASWWLLAA